MAKPKALQFLWHEIVLSFVGALIIAFGAVLTQAGITPFMLNLLLSTLVIWLGLLLFVLPLVRKLEKL